MVLPPYWNGEIPHKDELADRGFRLIAVGDNRNDRLEIKVWDISFLLRQLWDPLEYKQEEEEEEDEVKVKEKNSDQNHHHHNEINLNDWQNKLEWSKTFPWWKYGSQHLRLLGLRTMYERIISEERQHRFSSYVPTGLRLLLRNNTRLRTIAKAVPLPLLPYGQTMILSHSFYKPNDVNNINNDNNNNGNNNSNNNNNSTNNMDTTMIHLEDNDMNNDENELPVTTVKYAAYNVLCTSLFLLTEDGMVTVLDIETGKVTGTIDNVAASSSITLGGFDLSNTRKIRGIDVNVVAGNEVVVTSREGLLRSVMF